MVVSTLLCGKTCKYVTRIVFLVFIIIVTGYFIWLNNKEEKEIRKELFQQQQINESAKESDITKMIKEIFMDLYKRPPNLKEIQFYTEYASDKPTITKGQLMDVIESTNPEISKTFEPTNTNPIISANDPEQIVIEAYSEVLFRMPSPTELKKYSDMLKKDSKFTKDRLVFILMSTEEYMRMEKTQTNTVYSNLPGGVTDRQVTMTIERIYRDVSGQSYVDQDTMRFFKKKFLEFEMDEVKFKVFIERYVMWTDEDPVQTAVTKPIVPTTSGSAVNKSTTIPVATKEDNTVKSSTAVKTQEQDKTTSNIVSSNTQSSNQVKPSTNHPPPEDFAGSYYNNSTIYNIYTVGETDYLGVPNRAFLNSLSEKGDTGNVIKSITCQKGVISSSTDENMKKTTELSSYIENRNREQLASTCARTRKFADIDEDDEYAAMFYTNIFTKEDMVLDPSLRWSVPQRKPPVCAPNSRCGVSPLSEQTALIGTPIDEAIDTKWGSILPSLPPN